MERVSVPALPQKLPFSLPSQSSVQPCCMPHASEQFCVCVLTPESLLIHAALRTSDLVNAQGTTDLKVDCSVGVGTMWAETQQVGIQEPW